MPGIVGIIGSSADKKTIGRMTATMKHEEFYSIDTYVDENVAFGITSLAPNGITPDRTGTIFAAIDGEVFGLTKKNNETDVQALLRLYEEEETGFLSRITGRFALLLYDKPAKRLLLVSDRYGFRPLYYAEPGDRFVFASEIKAILSLPKFNKEIDPAAVAEITLFNHPLAQRTLIKDIRRLPPASVWHLSVAAGVKPMLTMERHSDPVPQMPENVLSPRQSMEQGPEVFREVVNRLKKGESRIGLTLTAGYDTRMILSAIGSTDVQCLTFGSKEDVQAVVARELAQTAHLEHRVQEFEDDFTERLEQLMQRTVWITDGLCNVVQCGLLYVFGKEAMKRPYFLGLGGSEIIRGLQNTSLALSTNSKRILLSADPRSTLRNICNASSSDPFFASYFSPGLLKNSELRESMIEDFCPSILDSSSSIRHRATLFTLLEIFRKYYCSNVALLESQIPVRLPYMTHEFISFILRTPYSIFHTSQFSRNPFERLKGQRFSATMIKHNNPELLMVPTDRGYAPVRNLHWFGCPVIFWRQIRRRCGTGATPELPLLRSSARNIIEKIVQPGHNATPWGHDYYDMGKLKEALHAYPNWSLGEWQELTRIVTFELYMRQLTKQG